MLILSLLMDMIKHSQITQSNKFAISLQYHKKEVWNGVHFWHADKSQSFYKLVSYFLAEVTRHVQNTQNRKLVIFLQYIKNCRNCFVSYCDAKHSEILWGSNHVCCYLFYLQYRFVTPCKASCRMFQPTFNRRIFSIIATLCMSWNHSLHCLPVVFISFSWVQTFSWCLSLTFTILEVTMLMSNVLWYTLQWVRFLYLSKTSFCSSMQSNNRLQFLMDQTHKWLDDLISSVYSLFSCSWLHKTPESFPLRYS